MADFSQLEPNQQVPTPSGRSVDGLGLTNPDSVLSGQNRGTQSIGGSANIQSDPSGQRLVVNDNTTNRVAFGRIGTGVNDWGMKVSKAGVPVDTATSDQLIFNSSQDVFKIVNIGTGAFPDVSVGAPGAGNYGFVESSTTIAHNLGYTPAVSAYILSSGNLYTLLPYSSTTRLTATSADWENFSIFTDATNIYLDLSLLVYGALGTTSVSGSTFKVKYYLLQETAT